MLSAPRQQIILTVQDDVSPSPVILNGGKNVLWKRREMER